MLANLRKNKICNVGKGLMFCQDCKSHVARRPKFCGKVRHQTRCFDNAADPDSAKSGEGKTRHRDYAQFSVIYPTSGTPNLPPARFCKKRCIPLWGATSLQKPRPPLAEPARHHSRTRHVHNPQSIQTRTRPLSHGGRL